MLGFGGHACAVAALLTTMGIARIELLSLVWRLPGRERLPGAGSHEASRGFASLVGQSLVPRLPGLERQPGAGSQEASRGSASLPGARHSRRNGGSNLADEARPARLPAEPQRFIAFTDWCSMNAVAGRKARGGTTGRGGTGGDAGPGCPGDPRDSAAKDSACSIRASPRHITDGPEAKATS